MSSGSVQHRINRHYHHHYHTGNNTSGSMPSAGSATAAHSHGIGTGHMQQSSQRFCLRWNNHQSNLLSVFDQLLHDESFVDVTLAVDGQLLRAHKIVLSACSPYFQALFINHPDKHPIVILKDVPYADMRSLLDFMYRGEVSVDQDRLTAFLRVAESLRIKGLTEVNEERCDNITSSLAAHQFHHQQIPHLQRLSSSQRKRGRPRKLSGCSNGTPGEDFDNGNLVMQGSPEMLEVKMGMDGFGGSTGGENQSDGGCSTNDKMEENSKDIDNINTIRDDESPTKAIKLEYEPLRYSMGNESRCNDSNNKDMSQTVEVSTDNDIHSSDASMAHYLLLTPKSETNTTTSSANGSPSHNSHGTDTVNRSSNSLSDAINNNSNNNNKDNSKNESNSTASTSNTMNAPAGRQPVKRRVRRRATSQCNDPAEQLTEMSVRGLNLFRYASINEGVYQCTECAKADVQKTFKNKYSFQRHAFLYHEGQQRKVFPCPVCQKEFSRPDKMKNHMKTVHDCFMPKDVVFPPIGYFPIP